MTIIRIKKGSWTEGSTLFERKLTLVHPFYGEEERLRIQFDTWCSWPDEIKDALRIVVIDDHGTPAITDMLTKDHRKRCDFDLTVLRVLDDLKWSTPGALNLGILTADTSWVLIMDSDCLFETKEMKKLLSLKPTSDWAIKFPRFRVTDNETWAGRTRFLPCTILFHKDMFMDLHGFDEDFIGTFSKGYGHFDTHFDHKIKTSDKYHLGQVKEITATEYMDDYVGPRIVRSGTCSCGSRVSSTGEVPVSCRWHSPTRVNRRLFRAKQSGRRALNMKMLNFNWEVAWRNKR